MLRGQGARVVGVAKILALVLALASRDRVERELTGNGGESAATGGEDM